MPGHQTTERDVEDIPGKSSQISTRPATHTQHYCIAGTNIHRSPTDLLTHSSILVQLLYDMLPGGDMEGGLLQLSNTSQPCPGWRESGREGHDDVWEEDEGKGKLAAP